MECRKYEENYTITVLRALYDWKSTSLLSGDDIVTENPSNERFRCLKLSDLKLSKSFVRIGQNFKVKMA